MNKIRTFLISGLATITLIITLVETGFLNLESRPLIAQEDINGLILEKDGEQVLILLEEWIVVVSAYDPSNTVGGIYMGMAGDALRLKEKKLELERELPFNEIGSIFRGKTKSTKEYVWGGIKVGGLVSVGIGGFFTVMLLNDSRSEGTIYPLSGGPFYWGGLFGLWSGFFTVPAGALIGYMRGQAAQGNKVGYVMGDGEWVIVK